ncbi:hypothetical protein B0H11DRAFT_2246842 [Mycena galericulata]|nr:hypothetical protein B0H11DRAFT_2246842 [Mycena galericulata]
MAPAAAPLRLRDPATGQIGMRAICVVPYYNMSENNCRDLVLYRPPAATSEHAAEQRSREAASMGLWIHRYLTNRERPSRSRGEWYANLDYGFARLANPGLFISYDVGCQYGHIDGTYRMQGGYGRTDGEGIETAWAEQNQLFAPFREMGAGRRHDNLDFFVRSKL